MPRGAAGRCAAVCGALLHLELGLALQPWPDGTWYDAPKDFNVAVPICKVTAEAMPPLCPPDWDFINGSCYTVLGRECEWQEAVAACSDEAHGAKLASVTSAQENQAVQGLCGRRMCWLGLHEVRDADTDGSWQWEDGRPVTYENWHKGEPSNIKGLNENVAIMNFGWKQFRKLERDGGWADGDWYDVSGVFNKPSPLCERPAVSNDGVAHCSDGWEESSGSCYRLLDWNCTHAEATDSCEQRGARLVSIDSEEEQMLVRALCGLRMCWLGLLQHPTSKAWSWADGSSMVFANWGRGEPNNVGGHENRAMMNFDASWMLGKRSKWRKSQLRNVPEGMMLVAEERVAAQFRLGAMGLFTVAYMAAYILRQCWGVKLPGGPPTAVSAVLFVVFAGGILDRLLWRDALSAMSLLLAVAAAEALYIGGLHTGICKPLGFSAPGNVRSPAMAGVLE